MSRSFTIAQLNALKAAGKTSKYKNEKAEVEGIKFDSKKEAKRYGELKIMERAGLIQDLRLQTVYRLEVGGKLICKYKCDFEYLKAGSAVVEDAKGFRTPVYKLKAKLFEAIYGFKISEV